MSEPFHIGFLIFPDVTQLDFTGPAQVLAGMSGAVIHVVGTSADPVSTDVGFSIVPTCTLEACPPLDMICVPGGGGTAAAMQDPAILSWLRSRARQARIVSSVCTGSLVLGAAGLLEGKRATSHWAWRHLLEKAGAQPVDERIVVDGNLITGGGVTAGIDFAFRVIEQVRGRDEADQVRLMVEYDPEPVGAGGTPRSARPEILERLQDVLRPFVAEREQALDRGLETQATLRD